MAGGFRGCAPRGARSPQGRAALTALIGGAALMLASGAGAETLCRFDFECFDREGCVESGFELRLDDARTVLSTEFGNQPVVARVGDTLVAEGPGSVYLLSIGDMGARLAVHINGPLALSYFGACE